MTIDLCRQIDEMNQQDVKQIYPSQGLALDEVIARRASGEGNNVTIQTSRSYTQILQENLFTFINGVFFTLSMVFFLLGRSGDGFVVVIVIFGGVLVNICQEIWAKQKLDQIALLNRPTVTVIREAKQQHIDPSEIVRGDILLLQPGDQIVVDGIVVGEGRIEVDESLLTGESDLISKVNGQPVYSGSFCVSGTACYEAQKVGTETFAYQLITGARAYRQILTPLQFEINLAIRTCLLIACFLGILILISLVSRSHSPVDVLQRIAVVAGLVPAGLLLAITLAYGLGAVRMVGENILLQQANAIESLSNVNILCVDKTGTLTTNQIDLQRVYPINITEAELRSLLGDYAASTKAGNKTSEAIAAACSGQVRTPVASVPFSSARKWSYLAFDDEQGQGVYVLGAPEMLAGVFLNDEERIYIQSEAQKGLRVLLFAYSPDINVLEEAQVLPASLKPLGILSFSDQLRPQVQETLHGFAQAGIEVKVISGDNPQTVAALAKQAGLSGEIKAVSGEDLAQMDAAQFAQTAQSSHVFGRITPEQKAMLVQTLRNAGHYVAMTGDGVNDVLSLKRANLAIAMESGSRATRGVADIVLLKDSFAALPHTFLEGQRIRNGIQDVMKLFMVRVFCVTLLIFATAIVTDSFPMENKQSALVSLLGAGLPTIFIPIWAKPGKPRHRSLVRSLLNFTLPATLTLTLIALLIYLLYLVMAVLDIPPTLGIIHVDYSVPRTALVSILVLGQLCLIPFLKPPTTAWVAAEPLNGDWRYFFTALILLVVYAVILAIPPLREFFELAPLSIFDHLFFGLVALEWCLIVRFVWRTRFLDKFLGVDLS